MAGSMRWSDGSGVGKNLLGELYTRGAHCRSTAAPVATRFSRSNKIGHNNVDI